ncbi:MAG TPA: hypothetical protein VEU62_21220 [Bryobacterales bacterium]|nr:hypothetical protein [Bryobacterales bacterium]
MKSRQIQFALTASISVLFSLMVAFPLPAADKSAAEPSGNDAVQEVESLKAKLAGQQKQLEQLRLALEAQGKLIERMSASQQAAQGRASAEAAPASESSPGVRNLGKVASLTPMVPAAALPPAAPLPALPAAAPAPAAAPQGENAPKLSPLSIPIGSAWVTPIGFMDFTDVFRSTTGGSGIGTNFGGIPFSNTAAGRLTENRFSAQNSRVGLRVDAKVRGADVIGYLESDFLGNAPGNLAVSSNSATLRMRVYWVDVAKDKWEILGGQSWSMLTPNRRGLSALPGDLFYSQDMDTNYQVGLTWTRQPQFRFILHASNKITWGVSFESAEQYMGGSAGGGTVTLPTALASPYGSQLNNGGSNTGVPNLHPDVISKIAFDGRPNGHAVHFEVAGLLRSFKVFNPVSSRAFTTTGGGGSVNFNFELVKNFRLIGDTFFSDGGGRYLFGQAPDLIVRGDGSPSLIHARSAIGGFEWNLRNSLLYAYYGGMYVGRNSAVDPANGKLVGYGFGGSSNGNNRNIQEASFGLVQTFWRDPRYGALSLITQYSYLTRDPWFVALGQPKNAHASMAFVDLRYTLPGSPTPASEGTVLGPGNQQLKSP